MTESLIKSNFTYDPNTGSLLWAVSSASKIKVGDKAGTPNGNGYLVVKVLGRIYLVHRVVWFLYNGEWPDGQIDHINGVRFDNRISNLRVVSSQDNSRNKKKYKNNRSGVVGVGKRGDRYVARIRVEGLLKYLGSFETLEEATKARVEAEVNYGFHFNHGRT